MKGANSGSVELEDKKNHPVAAASSVSGMRLYFLLKQAVENMMR
ncbi:hypothetical protein ACTHRH_25435 [Paenibacillus sp. SAFN-117]